MILSAVATLSSEKMLVTDEINPPMPSVADPMIDVREEEVEDESVLVFVVVVWLSVLPPTTFFNKPPQLNCACACEAEASRAQHNAHFTKIVFILLNGLNRE